MHSGSQFACTIYPTLIFEKVGLAYETRTLAYDNYSSLVSQATPFAERKGLVTLQPLSCHHGRNMMWPIRSALFVACIQYHGVQLRHNVHSGCHLTAVFDSCIPQYQEPGYEDRPDPSFPWRVWFARLHKPNAVSLILRPSILHPVSNQNLDCGKVWKWG